MRRALREVEATQRLADEGVARLVYGVVGEDLVARRRLIDDAVESLGEAFAASRGNAGLQNDLAAGLLVRGEAFEDSGAYLDALEAVETAWSLDPSIPEIAWNRALVYSHFGLRAGREAWQTYLRLGPSEDGRDRASVRLGELARLDAPSRWRRTRHRLLEEGPLSEATARESVSEHPQLVRMLVEDELLPAWGRSVETGDRESSERVLDRARQLAEALEAATGHRRLLDSVEQALSAGSGKRSGLARAFRLYGAARAHHETQRYSEAKPLFEAAVAGFDRSGSPFAFWPAFFLAVEEHHRPGFENALRALTELEEVLGAEDQVELGYVAWMRGLSWARLAQRELALREYRMARRCFAEAGEIENRAQMDTDIAVLLDDMGRFEEGWQHHAAALAETETNVVKPRRALNILEWAAKGARKRDRSLAAAVFQGEAVRIAVRSENPLQTALALGGLAELEEELGRREEALVHVEGARRAALSVPDPGLVDDLLAGLAIVEARVLAAQRPDEATLYLSSALRFVEERKARHLRIPLLLEEAAIHHRHQLPDPEEAALRDALSEVERQREQLVEAASRIGFLDEHREAVDRLVALLWDQGRRDEAFMISERHRARSLRDELRATSAWGALEGVRSYPSLLPERTALLYFHELEDRVLVWSLRRTGWSSRSIGIRRPELAASVTAVRVQAQTGNLDEPALRELSNLLLGPEIGKLESEDAILLVPDGPLHSLPFALLTPDGVDGFLVERFATAICPGAQVCFELIARARALARTSRPESVVLFTDIDHSTAYFPDLPRLRHGAEESARIGSQFRVVRGIRGSDATREVFLSQALSGDVLYFGGHGLAGTDRGSGILLAPEDEFDDGWLGAGDLGRWRPGKCRLAILAACETGVGDPSPTEGSMSLVRPFLGSGVPSVIASLWNIDDARSVLLMADFIRRVQEGARHPWQEAQLSELARIGEDVTDYSWAGYSFVGAL